MTNTSAESAERIDRLVDLHIRARPTLRRRSRRNQPALSANASIAGDTGAGIPGGAAARATEGQTVADPNQRIIDEFRANDGAVGGYFAGRTLLLLHHKGAKSGIERVNPLAYQRLADDAVAIFASKSGAPSNPDWYYNVVANPDVRVEIGTETLSGRARVAHGEERERIWVAQKLISPRFAEYETTTGGREIPVIVIDLG
jgi:deazaflavin-dependent oxidoreductase (nitroreductase family)